MSELTAMRKILVLGASGLIGRFVTDDLRIRGFGVVAIARKFSAGQRTNASDLEMPILSMAPAALARLLRDHRIDVVVNCLGVVQDGPGSDTAAVHRDFVVRLLQAIGDCGHPLRLIQISIPGSGGSNRLQRDKARGGAADRGLRHCLCDIAAGPCSGASRLWRQRAGARARRAAGRSARG
jgi:nucleoside-diphosphate-sugar epimerase